MSAGRLNPTPPMLYCQFVVWTNQRWSEVIRAEYCVHVTHLSLPTETGHHSIELGAGAAVEPPAGPHQVGVVAVVEHARLPANLAIISIIIILITPQFMCPCLCLDSTIFLKKVLSLPKVHCSQSWICQLCQECEHPLVQSPLHT